MVDTGVAALGPWTNHIAVHTVVLRQTTRVNMVGWTNSRQANSMAIPVKKTGQYCSIWCRCLSFTRALAVTIVSPLPDISDSPECCSGIVRSKPNPRMRAISLSARRRKHHEPTKMTPRRK